MSEPADELEVVLEEEPGTEEPKVGVAKPQDAPPEPAKAPETDAALDELKSRLVAETAGRQAAERRAAAEAQERQRAQAETHESHVALVDNALNAAKAQREALRVRLKEARIAGDVDAELDIQDELDLTAAKLVQLEQGKASMASAPKPQERPVEVVDRVEHLARQMDANGFPHSASWIRAHPEFARDDNKYAAMIGAHNVAVNGRGLRPESDDYFRYIEEQLGVRTPERPLDEPMGRPIETPPPAAPVSRGSEINGKRRNVVTLTPAQREAADIAGVSYQEYAKQVLALDSETKH